MAQLLEHAAKGNREEEEEENKARKQGAVDLAPEYQ